MKIGHFARILAILILIGIFIQPVPAAGNETTDAATNYYNIGVNLLEAKEYARAIVSFDQALASNTTMIRGSDALLYTYQNKAYALIQLSDYTAAIQAIDQGLAVYNNDEKLLYNKGYANFRLGNYQDALTAYDIVLQVNNASLPAMNNRGDTLYAMGRYQDAVDAYSRAHAIDPNDTYSAAGLAKAQNAAAGAMQTTMIIVTIILLIVAAGVIWYLKYRKPAETTPPDEKTKGKTKGKKK